MDARFDGLAVYGVDEHMWRHARRGERYVTVVIDLTPISDGTGPARLLDMVEGRSKQAFKTWLAVPGRGAMACRWSRWVRRLQDRHAEELPAAVAVMDPCHVVQLAGDPLDRCRRRVQQDLHDRRGCVRDPLCRARSTLDTGANLLTDKQTARIKALFAAADHV